MKIGLLDPALFLERAESEIIAELEFIQRSCRDHGIELVPLREYWTLLWKELGRPLERLLSSPGRLALQALYRLAPRSDAHVAALSPSGDVAWRRGFTVLFGGSLLEPSWADRMALAVIRAVSSRQEVVVFCRRVVGRNLTIHGAGNSTLHENTRWMLYVQPRGVGPCQVLCVHHPRNLRERWTSRFDWRLPAVSDRARYPFCVPSQWWKRSTIAFRTLESKPV